MMAQISGLKTQLGEQQVLFDCQMAIVMDALDDLKTENVTLQAALDEMTSRIQPT